MSPTHVPFARRTLAAAAVVAATLLLGGCAGISQRAIDNGAAMDPQVPLQYRNMRDMSELRAQYYQIAPLRSLYRTKPYQPFSRW